jgi:hypothetical protein
MEIKGMIALAGPKRDLEYLKPIFSAFFYFDGKYIKP